MNTHYALRWYAASMTAIVLVWAAVVLYGVRELSHALRMVP